MGLLAKERVLLVLIFCVGAVGFAAEGPYHFDRIDYFGMTGPEEGKIDPADAWLDPGYRPPQVVIDLLEDPRESTARRYLQWNRERLEKIKAAQRAVDAAAAAEKSLSP
jgi:hypothetical protein